MKFTYPNENNGGSDGEKSVELNEVLVLLLVTATVHVELFDAFNGQFFMLQSDFIGVGGKFAGVAVDVCWERGREKNNLNSAGNNPTKVRWVVPRWLRLTPWRGCTGLPDLAGQACYRPHPTQEPSMRWGSSRAS